MEKYFVYQHIRKDKNTIFYIGIGKIREDFLATTDKMKHYRAYSKQGRNPIWKAITNKSEYSVEIITTGVTKEEAITLEIQLIEKYGKIKNKGLLSNISNGGETVLPELLTVLNDPKCSELVYQYDLEGNFIKEWLSTNQIKRELGFDNSVIRKALRGKTKSPNISYKYQWYLEYKGVKIDGDFDSFGYKKQAEKEYNPNEVMDPWFKSDYATDRKEAKAERKKAKEDLQEYWEKEFKYEKINENDKLIIDPIIEKLIREELNATHPLDIRGNYNENQERIE